MRGSCYLCGSRDLVEGYTSSHVVNGKNVNVFVDWNSSNERHQSLAPSTSSTTHSYSAGRTCTSLIVCTHCMILMRSVQQRFTETLQETGKSEVLDIIFSVRKDGMQDPCSVNREASCQLESKNQSSVYSVTQRLDGVDEGPGANKIFHCKTEYEKDVGEGPPVLTPQVSTAQDYPASTSQTQTLQSQERTGKGQFKCEFCPFQASGGRNLKRHSANHSTNYPFKCSYCTYSADRKSSIVGHEKMHSRFGDIPIKKEIVEDEEKKGVESDRDSGSCEMPLLSLPDEKIERNGSQDDLPPPLLNPVSGTRSTARKRYVAIRRARSAYHQQQQKMLSCPFCSFKSKQQRVMTGHIASHKAKTQVPKDKFNSTNFDMEGNASSPTLIPEETDDSRYLVRFQCKHCTFWSGYRRTVICHELRYHAFPTHNSENSVVSKVGKGRSSGVKSSTDQQLRKSSRRRRPVKEYTELVNAKANIKSQKNKSPLQGDDLKSIKRHRCSFCPYSTQNSNCLRMHERTHTGEKPYVCRRCGWEFAQKANMKRHVRSKHMTEPTEQELEPIFGNQKNEYQTNEGDSTEDEVESENSFERILRKRLEEADLVREEDIPIGHFLGEEEDDGPHTSNAIVPHHAENRSVCHNEEDVFDESQVYTSDEFADGYEKDPLSFSDEDEDQVEEAEIHEYIDEFYEHGQSDAEDSDEEVQVVGEFTVN